MPGLGGTPAAYRAMTANLTYLQGAKRDLYARMIAVLHEKDCDRGQTKREQVLSGRLL